MGIILKFPMGNVVRKKDSSLENIIDVAKYFLNRRPMTLRKLQSVCYFAQCHYIGSYDKKLIDADFEAWKNGPTSRELYDEYFAWESLEIYSNGGYCLKNETINFLNKIFLKYGTMGDKAISKLIKKDMSWLNARIGLKKNEPCIIEIDMEEIHKDYFWKEKIYE